MQHVKDQNWFAVGLDVIVVIVGIFLGMQVQQWYEDNNKKQDEQFTLVQLENEFREIKSHLEKQISARSRWTDYLAILVATIEETKTDTSDQEIKLGLDAASNAGRQAPQSATFLQLLSSGELSLITSPKLRKLLMQYDSRLKRDAFVHEMLIDLVFKEFSDNRHVDRNMFTDDRVSAQIDRELDSIESVIANIRSFDLEEMKRRESHYEAIYRIHVIQLTAEETQLEFAEEILALISAAKK